MSPRKPAPVSLPSVGRLTQREQRDIAENAIRKFRSAGYRASQAPTAERLLRAGADARVVTVHENVEVSRGDRFEVEQVDVAQIRISDDPLSRLAARRQLDADATRNLAMFDAGRRYRRAFERTGLDSVRSVNLERVNCGSGAGLFASEAAANAFAQLTRMKDAVPPDYRDVLDNVVLHDMAVEDAGRKVSGYASPAQARVIALWVLRKALAAIAASVGLLERETILDAMKAAAESSTRIEKHHLVC